MNSHDDIKLKNMMCKRHCYDILFIKCYKNNSDNKLLFCDNSNRDRIIETTCDEVCDGFYNTN